MLNCLTLQNISKTFQDKNGETIAIKDFTYTFKKGKFTSIIGPSGCGKSTILSIIAGLESQTSGIISLDNYPLPNHNCNIGYMLQKDYLIDWRTVYKNILLGLEVKCNVCNETLGYVDSLLRKYGLFDFKYKFPSQLSGGMRQRVALIRTLAVNPDILLLDEAFSALDYQTRLLVTNDIYQIIKGENKTTIMVTHDIPESICMSDEVIVLSKRPSIIKEVFEIKFDIPERTPLLCRDNPLFQNYFDAIWSSLNSE